MSDENSGTGVAPKVSALREKAENIRKGLRVTKVTATRAINSRQGSTFAAMTAAWESFQDDSGTVDEEESSMSMEEAQLAQIILAKENSIAALRIAWANGAISDEELESHTVMSRTRYSQLFQDAMARSSRSTTPRENTDG